MIRIFRFPLITLGLFLLTPGCAPEILTNQCSGDFECFPTEACVAGLCEVRTPDIAPKILLFRTDELRVEDGTTITIEWRTANATGAKLSFGEDEEINIADDELGRGTANRLVEQNQILTLTVEGEGPTVSETIEIEAFLADPNISSFEASRAIAPVGSTVTLTWATKSASTVALSANQEAIDIGDDASSGSLDFTMVEHTEFELIAVNANQVEVSESISVAVTGAFPNIASFAVSPISIVEGESAELSWQLEETNTFVIRENGVEMDLTGQDITSGSISVQPTESTTYILTASNAVGTTMAAQELTVLKETCIVSFDASATLVTYGNPLTLFWELCDEGYRVNLRDDQNRSIFTALPAERAGSAMVAPTEDTTYTLEVSAAGQTDSRILDIEVLPARPTIANFSATPAVVVSGGPTELSWDILGAASIEITDDLGTLYDTSGKSVVRDTLDVTITQPVTFTLRATNSGGDSQLSATVTTADAVSIVRFDASPDPSGDPGIILEWETLRATSIELIDSQGEIYDMSGKSIDNDTISVFPLVTTDYTLTAQGPYGPISAVVTHQIAPSTDVEIISAVAVPTTILAGEFSDLMWETRNATGLTITYPDPSDPTQTLTLNTMGKILDNDFVRVFPSETTQYTMTVTGSPMDLSAVMEVIVTQPVEVLSFVATPQTVSSGGSATLGWTTSGASSLTLTDHLGNSIDISNKAVSMDSIDVFPTVDTLYKLTAWGNQGSYDELTANVTVQ